jgi:hypothetical protein
MTQHEEDMFMEQIERWDVKHARKDFLARMEKKLNRKGRF